MTSFNDNATRTARDVCVPAQEGPHVTEVHLSIRPDIQDVVRKARQSSTVPAASQMPQTKRESPHFINMLALDVTIWISSIQTLTTKQPSGGTAAQQLAFWLDLEASLEELVAQLNNPEVSLTLACLGDRDRLREDIMSRSGLQGARALVEKYAIFFRDFPLDPLFIAKTFDQVQEAIECIFNHTIRQMRPSPFPVRLSLALIQAISYEFQQRIIHILRSFHLLSLSYSAFDSLLAQSEDAFWVWGVTYREYYHRCREFLRRRCERFVPIKLPVTHRVLEDRIGAIHEWRKRHEQLVLMVRRYPCQHNLSIHETGMETMSLELQLSRAYNCMAQIDVLDVSENGVQVWAAAQFVYDEQVSSLRSIIIERRRTDVDSDFDSDID